MAAWTVALLHGDKPTSNTDDVEILPSVFIKFGQPNVIQILQTC